MSVFLDLVEASGKRNTFDIERLVFHHYFAVRVFVFFFGAFILNKRDIWDISG